MVVIVIVGRVVIELELYARPGGVGVTAAERDSIHQVLPLHVAQDTTERHTRDIVLKCSERAEMLNRSVGC